jgi:hypothetical protein
MRMFWRLLAISVVVLTLGCGGSQSSYKDREAAGGDDDPSAAMGDMAGEAAGTGGDAAPAK